MTDFDDVPDAHLVTLDGGLLDGLELRGISNEFVPFEMIITGECGRTIRYWFSADSDIKIEGREYYVDHRLKYDPTASHTNHS